MTILKVNRWLKYFGFFVVVLFLIGLVDLGFKGYGLFYRPMAISEDSSRLIRLDKQTSASTFVQALNARHFIQSPRLFLWYIRALGYSQRLKAGVYSIGAGESAIQFLRRVIEGDVVTLAFRIIEGTTLAQVNANLEKAEDLIYSTKDWQPISGHYPSAEGLLLADTYHYDAGSQSKALLEQASRHLQQFLAYNWEQRTPGLPYKNAYELLIAASIVEKEASKPREKRLIAGVIINRLRRHMPLQMDPTVIYGLGNRYHGQLTHEDLLIDTPYNTYRYRGLPPTPIAMVGKDAIDAAAHPELTDYLYFVATGDGSHYFSTNYEQQQRAVARYRGMMNVK